MSLRSWARRARAAPASGPEQALEHADALYNLARYLTRHPGDAEDLVQETYARAIAAWDRLEPGSNVKAWLFRILRNAFLSRYRRDHVHAGDEPYDTTEPAAAAPGLEPSLMGDRELDRMRRLVGADIEAALGQLSEPARTVVLLDAEGFTEGELAGVLGCAIGTVKSRLSRARAELRLLLADYASRETP
ncbi:sigma-70 family RNA polymerase sigma factor [Anaeromyxobacter diazotrophicus]|uniref:RNA polymerase sigma factor n=1 Tax=Anaeromyxobacter diazotrophicus TaxID=2590199 RepID=A0A7I9VHA7_9BACT|nr:sigma-70 family RNA polymerase sigma factor [Anaeromyxobacter diazotrophicus]GEJ55776.1 RNA polymerase sigma factor [Anaeromyxobacter diazotrophicus]